MLSDVAFQQEPAILIIEVDDFNTVVTKPVETARESTAFANDNGAEAKLSYKAAAIPAWRERCNHNQVAIAALAAGTAKCIRFAVNAGIAVLHAAVVAAADKFSGTRKDGSTDGNSSFGATQARFIERDLKHLFVLGMIHNGKPLVPA
jgi:hypothetical protein